jgi:threonine dehydratase
MSDPFSSTASTLDDIRRAHERIRPHVHRTPIFTSRTLNERFGAELFFKCENLQRAGSFKIRGAANAVFSLSPEEARRGVVTHSSGNHAQAVALAARLRGIRAIVVMPENAPAVKVAAVRAYGGEIVFCFPTLASREETAQRVVEETGATLIHSYNDERVIQGQGTVALELLEDVPDLDLLLVPVGGGGLISGMAIASKALRPSVTVIGCEPEQADDAFRSLREGRIIPVEHPNTIADGLRTSLGEKTFAVIRSLVDQIVLVSEEAIVQAMRFLFERLKLVVEPSGAVPLAALLEEQVDVRGRRVGLVLSGGNVDLEKLPFRTG